MPYLQAYQKAQRLCNPRRALVLLGLQAMIAAVQPPLRDTLYIVPGHIRFKIITEYELEEGCEDDEAPDDEAPIEEYFFTAFLQWMQFPPRHDDCEIGYPDKFLSMQQQGWACEGIRRYGQWSSEAAATDDELYRLIGGEEGTNTIIYHRMSSPHLHLHWQDFQRQAALCLAGNEAWTCGFKHICSLAEEMSAQASMTISIYNPMNWPLSLFKWIVNGDRNYLPAFEAIATTADRGLALVGVTRWDGSTKLDSVRLLFMASGCIDMLGFIAFWHRGAAWELDTDLMDCLGLSYQMVLLEFRPGVEPSTTLLSYENGSLVAVPDAQRGRNLEEFVRENQPFLLELTAEISSFAWGL